MCSTPREKIDVRTVVEADGGAELVSYHLDRFSVMLRRKKSGCRSILIVEHQETHVAERLASGLGVDRACLSLRECEVEDLEGPRFYFVMEKQRQ